ncbi:TraG family conjugative transposon ATPase [Sphingobacterium chungjuense]|uniref:TraG family conjugative transposon ATPase n=1 Tax=Sphingobacterium chungjuense TaxID=2675553 RepID=UPI001408AFE8|nr:TraG family conjugative transposon ATPase [Sphingobacterium chungjuense]
MKSEKKSTFEIPYVGIDHYQGMAMLYGSHGDFSVVMRLTNPVLQYGADPEAYTTFQQVLLGVVKILGEGHIIQKQDVFIRRKYRVEPASEFLQQKYQDHFDGREYTEIRTYLTITRQIKRGAFYIYDKRVLVNFGQNMAKVFDLLVGAGLSPAYLTEAEINRFTNRVLGMEFEQPHITLNNLRCGDSELQIGEQTVRCISLVNTDSVDLPEKVGAFASRTETSGMRDFPVDNLFFMHRVPGYRTIVYNQLLQIPSQQVTLGKLEVKRKRHSSVPDPANLMCVEDINFLLVDVARENQLLVNAHYSMIVCADTDRIDKTVNYIEAALFQQGIIPSRNAYNQLELFRCALPGNGVELKKYDWFLTTADAALCFFFREALPRDEKSDFLIRFTDRQGIPVGIDPADLPMRTNRINNRNKFVLGPSGSGKSFFMNALVQQYMLYNMDVVIVDTGHSYSGLCDYFGGRYITWSDTKPITMNPFAIGEDEYNIEKKDFLATLVCLLWKGADGTVSPVERDVISNVISSYYADYFGEKQNGTDQLNFNSFYDFALHKIPQIKSKERIPFDLDEFRYVLKKFYRGGEFDAILNEAADSSLFSERFIVFEIDAVKENKILFPIVTLVIMDVFIQKMRHRKDQRKALIIEEAWKAIASPLMGSYILYLYKTVRKFWGEAVVVTQELVDIIGNAVVKDSILNNSDTVCLLDQSKFIENYGDIAKLLAITETERKKIFTIGKLDNTVGRSRFKEVYIRRGSIGEVFGVEVSIYQYLAFTTEKPEKSAVEIYVNHHGNYQSGLEAFVSDLEKSGLVLDTFVRRVNQTNTPIETPREYFKPDFT